MKVYLVGGAVRDSLLGLTPKDRDWVIVGATDEDVKRMLDEGYEQVGADFPVFLHPEASEEYALARVERKTGTGYGGFTVDTENVSLEEDLMRRDLTINSMAMDLDGNIIDPYGGQDDLQQRRLHHTSPAFAEDPLRVLRLARFFARYADFEISASTVDLCQEIGRSGELNNLSVERIWVELEKGFGEARADRFLLALGELQAVAWCDVLQRIFGSQIDERQLELCRKLDLAPKDLRMIIAVAAISTKHRKLIGAPKRLVSVYDHLLHVFRTSRNAVDLQALLQKAGAYKEGTAFSDLVWTMKVMTGDPHFEFTAEELERAAGVGREVRAAMFPPELTGKALGDAIEFERISRLEKALGIPRYA